MYTLLFCWRYMAAIALIVALSGCRSVRTEFPLSEAGTVVNDQSYVGLWQSVPDPIFPDTPPSTLQVTLLANSIYEVVCEENSGDNRLVARGSIIDIKGRHYFSLQELEEYQRGELIHRTAEHEFEVSKFISVSISSDILAYSYPEVWSFGTALKSHKLKYNDSDWSTGDILVKSTPGEFAHFLSQCHEDIFAEEARFRRVEDLDINSQLNGYEKPKPHTSDISSINDK